MMVTIFFVKFLKISLKVRCSHFFLKNWNFAQFYLGATINGDGCASDCKIEEGFMCNAEPSACSSICGDGFKVTPLGITGYL